MPVHVVFVCLGNICRSPMAEAIFQEVARQSGLDGQVTADSCGTAGWHEGEPPHPGTRKVLEAHNIPYEHESRKIEREDLTQADYLIAMDSDNLAGIHRLGKTDAEVSLLLSYAPEVGIREVPDPYYTDRFEEVYQMVEAGCRGLLARIRAQEHL